MHDAPPSDAPVINLAAEEPEAAALRPTEVVLPEDDADAPRLPKHATVLADGRVLLPLLFPVELPLRIGSGPLERKRFDELKLRRVTGLDKKVVAEQPADMKVIVLAARLSGMRVDLMNALYENMDGKDTTALEQVLGYFL